MYGTSGKTVTLQQCLNVYMVPVAKQLPYNSV